MSVTDDIKARIDIVDLVGQYTPLKKAGRNYKALCPFHSEKTPSFVVFPDSQSWRCFGACGEGGDIFSFVMKHEGWDFAETLRVLADQAGVELEPITPQQTESREAVDRLRHLLAEVAHFFHQHLLTEESASHARAYVEKRGLSAEIVQQFEIGYAPDGWEVTLNTFLERGYTRDEMVRTGLLVVKDEGGVYDRFRDRLMIPIRDGRGNMAGFGARGLTSEATPKYLNSPQNDLFDKSSLLFGLDRARRSIREKETAVIVEGYMDVIQAHQAGFTNVVAQMGTALTEPQLRLLARYANRLILALDPDTAGQSATERSREVFERDAAATASEMLDEGQTSLETMEREHRVKLSAEFDAAGMMRYENSLGFDLRVAVLPQGYDPDDLIREAPSAWAELIDSAVHFVEYSIRTATQRDDIDDPRVKSQVIEDLTPIINGIADSVMRAHYRQRLARVLKIAENILFPQDLSVGNRSPKSKPGRGRFKSSTSLAAAPMSLPTDATLNPTLSREAFCLAALIQYPRLVYQINRVLAEYLDREALIRINPMLENIEVWPDLDVLAPYVIDSDFAHPEHRQIFWAWNDALNQDAVEPVSYLLETLDPLARSRVESWLDQPLYALLRNITPPKARFTDERAHEGAMQGLFDLRQKRLEDQLQELLFVVSDLDDGGNSLTVHVYGDTIRILTVARHLMREVRGRLSASKKSRSPNQRLRTG